MVVRLLKNVLLGGRRALRRAGLDVGRLSSPSHAMSGLYLSWSTDNPAATRGMVIDVAEEGRAGHFFVADPRDEIQRHHLNGHFYEPRELEVIATHLGAGDYVDVGANVGNHLVYLALGSPATRMVAFEPNPVARRLLEINLRLNILAERVEVKPVALGAEAGVGALALTEHNLGAARIDSARGTQPIVIERGDDQLSDRIVSFIKIDTEGHEIAVLEGLAKTIARCRPSLFVEVSTANRELFLRMMSDWKYREADNFARFGRGGNFLMLPQERSA